MSSLIILEAGKFMMNRVAGWTSVLSLCLGWYLETGVLLWQKGKCKQLGWFPQARS